MVLGEESIVECRDEESVFAALGLEYVPPQARNCNDATPIDFVEEEVDLFKLKPDD